jgi:thiosulfate/3-mercaptopyruvate sulfurtransferase
MSSALQGPLASVAWLKDHLHDSDLKVVDVRWYLSRTKHGGDAYEEGHIPGALFLDLDADLSAPSGPGRHPLPEGDAFEKALRRAGINARSLVIAYDDAGGSIASRLWWLLRWFGHERVAVLDGGLQAWVASGGKLTTELPAATAGDFRVKPPPPDWIVDRAEVHQISEAGRPLLLDARAPERYRGEIEPIDARPGHIPGARSAPWTEMLEGGHHLKTAEELRGQFLALGAKTDEPTVLYCGSGVTACLPLLAMCIAGLPGKLYPGGWSDWARHPSLPAEMGGGGGTSPHCPQPRRI